MEIGEINCLLTIAIPTYNRKELLKRALNSIIPQLNSKIEVLISDNASDDGTDEMVAESFPMVRYVRNETNRGAHFNFLRCYREARGKYVILLGSDDRLADGAVDYFTEFLEKNDCDLIFVNFRLYDVTNKEIYICNGEWIKNYSDRQDIITNDRNQFISYASHSITYMSASIAKRALVMDVNEPERFIETYFLHTCIMLESVKGRNAKFGVIMHPWIEANATVGESEMSKKSDKMFTVFGKYMYWVLCNHAVKCGFSKNRMRKVYQQCLQGCPFWKLLLSYKRRKNAKAVKNFWQDGYPVVKHFPSEWIKVMLIAFTPYWVINMIYRIYRAFKKSSNLVML